MLHYLKNHLPDDAYCTVGITWVDLYPSDEWNFVLGESSCIDGCAVMSFGHFEPQSYINNQLNETQSNSSDVSSLSNGKSGKDNLQSGSLITEKDSDLDLKVHLEDFACCNEQVDKQIIWRLLRVSS